MRWRRFFVCAALAAAGFVAPLAGGRPEGGLSGKIVYLHAGHGWTADNLGFGVWFTQRPETFEIVEDLLNQDLMEFQADALWNAGATIVPLRPIGHQEIERVLDNDDQDVSFSGAWFDSASPVFFGDVGDTPYKFAFTSPDENAVATYRPDLPEAGVYPVYAWTLGGSNRVEQVYRVHHSGGATEVLVDHRRVGGGLVYIGSYHFEAGTAGLVEISNRNEEAGVVIADMIRFGNGMGDIDRGGGVSGVPRHDEAALYWIEAHKGQGVADSAFRSSADDGTANVSAPTRWAAGMNLEAAGDPADRVFVSHHSNAGGGAARGVIALHNGNNDPGSATPNQFDLAFLLAAEINDDLVAQDAAFEHPWADRAVLTLDRSDFEFGEINNRIIEDEFDATIVERGFHDNQLDAELLRDADVCEAVARATCQGLVRYFHTFDNGETPLVFAPPRARGVRTIGGRDGSVTVRWTPPEASAWAGGTPTGYRVQVSANGRGFDSGVVVPGGSADAATFSQLGPGPHFFRVVAVNEGGWSLPSRVVAVTPDDAGPDVLIVDGFDRLDRFQNVREPFGGGAIDRVRTRLQNSRDYAVQAGVAIAEAGADVDTAPNEAIENGTVDLAEYDAVVWILGEESLANETFSPVEQSRVASYLDVGGALVVSGSELAWDLGFLGGGPEFLSGSLGGQFIADSSGVYDVGGVAESPFEGIDLSFDDGDVFYDAEFADVIGPAAGADTVMTYEDRLNSSAAVLRGGALGGGVVTFGFPLETILDAAARRDVVWASLEFLGVVGCRADRTEDGVLTGGDARDFVESIEAGAPATDLDGDGTRDFFDVLRYLGEFDEGCSPSD